MKTLGRKRRDAGSFWFLFCMTLLLISAFSCAPQPSPSPSPPSPAPTVLAPSTSPPPSPTLSPSPTPSSPSPPGITVTPTPSANPLPGYVDPGAVNSSSVEFASGNFTIKAYLSQPKSGTSFPGLLLLHDEQGLNPHIEDVARRFANQGYVTLAPDLLSRVGGTGQFATLAAVATAVNGLPISGVIQDITAAMAYLKPLSSIKAASIGTVGFGWGGGSALIFATRNADLKAVVVFYAPNPPNLNDAANITAPVLGLYGGDDTAISDAVPALDAAMKKYNKSFEYIIYSGSPHFFFDDTYVLFDAEVAKDAWKRTLAFLKMYLSA